LLSTASRNGSIRKPSSLLIRQENGRRLTPAVPLIRGDGPEAVVQFYGGYPGARWAVFRGQQVTGKVDCSAASAPLCGKEYRAAGLAAKCSVQLAYAIGVAKTFSIYVNTFCTGKIPDQKLEQIIEQVLINPAGMIKNSIFSTDHLPKNPVTLFLDDYRWEKTDMSAG